MERIHANLKYLLALAEFRHFGRAADHLGVSQPALSRSVKNLEEDLGVRLFERNRRDGIEPTVFGRLLLERGRELVAKSDELFREIELLKGREIGDFSVTSGMYPAVLTVAKAIGTVLARHPKLRGRMRIANWREATADVLARQTDVAIAETSEAVQEPRIMVEPLANHPLRFFGRKGHPLSSHKKLTIEKLVQFPWAAPRAPKRMCDFLPGDLSAAGWIDQAQGDFVPAILVDDLHSAVEAVLHSDAIGAAPQSILKQPEFSGRLQPLAFEAPWLRLNYGFIYLRNRTLSPAAQSFMDEVRLLEQGLIRK